jgi:hypothetical protein
MNELYYILWGMLIDNLLIVSLLLMILEEKQDE